MAEKKTILDIMKETDFTNLNLDTLKGAAEDAAEAFNEAVLGDKHSEINKARADGKAACKAYNDNQTLLMYHNLLQTKNPMLEAIKACYTPAIYFNVKPEKDTGMEKAKISDVENVINLVELEDAAERKLSPNGQWRYWIEKFTSTCAARANDDIGGDKSEFKKNYKLSEEAIADKTCNMAPTPTSNKQLLISLQSIIDAIMFEDNGQKLNIHKVLNKDINRILYLMCSKGKGKLSVSMPRKATMTALITEVYHRIITNGAYTAEYEMIKEKK